MANVIVDHYENKVEVSNLEHLHTDDFKSIVCKFYAGITKQGKLIIGFWSNFQCPIGESNPSHEIEKVYLRVADPEVVEKIRLYAEKHGVQYKQWVRSPLPKPMDA